jgi:hypothetical protein
MTWNAEGILSSGRELALLNLLNDNDVDIGIITETEIPSSSHGDFNVEGYHTFLPMTHSEQLKTAKYRVMIVVRSEMAALTKISRDLMHPAVQMIWVQVDLGNRFLVGGLYREWFDLPPEYTALTRIKDQIHTAASEVDNNVFAGDVNLDTARRGDKRYSRRCLLLAHDNAIAEANMRYLTTGVTYRLHGLHKREDGEARGRKSVLDHVCVMKDLEATVTVLTDWTTDHVPVVAAIKVNRVTPTQKTLKRRNFKALERPALIHALEFWPWSDVYGIRDPDKVLDFITKGIVNGLDLAAPSKSIKVKEGLLPLYLRPDTLAMMAKRDTLGRSPQYKAAGLQDGTDPSGVQRREGKKQPRVVQASGHPLRLVQGAGDHGQRGPGGLHEGEQHLAHVTARLPKGEVMHQCTRDSERGLGQGQGKGEGGGRGRV